MNKGEREAGKIQQNHIFGACNPNYNQIKNRMMNALKKTLSIMLIIGISSVSAQKAHVETVSYSLKSYSKEGEDIEVRKHSLVEAKKFIDEAAENSTTANDPKMYLMRARTYLAMQIDTLGPDKKSSLPDPDAIEVAIKSIVKCHKVDDKQKYSRSSDAYTAFVNIAINGRFIADVAYNNKEYDRSIKYYNLVRTMIPYDDEALLKRQNITDDGLLYNVATTEKFAEKYDDAKRDFNELIKRSYNDPWIYLELFDIYLNIDKDTNKAIEVIDKGRAMFEDEPNLRRQQIYIYSVSGRSQELIDIIDGNIELDPYNGNNYYLRGILYSELGEMDKAEADYLKAVEYNESLMAAYEDLGKLYFNKGAAIADEANKLGFNETEKFDKMNEEVKMYFNKAIPNFEKIYEYATEESDRNRAAQILLSMYLKTEQMDKYKALKAELQ